MVGTSERWKIEPVEDNVGASVTVVVGAVVLVPESVMPESVADDRFGRSVIDIDPAEVAAAVVFAVSVFAV
jgi:hypothetical protein